MLSRRIAGKFATGTILCQRRYDHERWYGHILDLDCQTYRYTGERPSWQRFRSKTEEELKFAKSVLPHVDFATTYECLLFDSDRLNIHLNRKEFANEIKFRLEKQANTVARAEALIKDKTYANDQRVEDIMISRIADEEHIQAEMKYVKCIRANELAEDNRLDILPGGSPNSLREKTRWNMPIHLHPLERGEIAARLTAWLPEKYHIVYFDDYQTVAANDAAARKKMLDIVTTVQKEHAEEATAGGYEEDLKDVIHDLQDDIDPTRHITSDAIAACSSLDTLEDWSHLVHEYNGDTRMFEIYSRCAELTKNEKHKALLQKMQTWWALNTK